MLIWGNLVYKTTPFAFIWQRQVVHSFWQAHPIQTWWIQHLIFLTDPIYPILLAHHTLYLGQQNYYWHIPLGPIHFYTSPSIMRIQQKYIANMLEIFTRVAGIYDGLISSPISGYLILKILLIYLGTSLVSHILFSFNPKLTIANFLSSFSLVKPELDSYFTFQR